MRFAEFSKTVNIEELSPCYFIFGDDFYFVKSAVDRLLSLCHVFEDDIDCSKFSDDGIQSFLDSLNTFPFMAERRVSVYVADSIDQETAKRLEKYAKSPNPTSLAIVVSKSLKKTSLKGFAEIDCSREKAEMVARWITLTLKRKGILIADGLSLVIARRLDSNMDAVSNAVHVLESYLDGRKEITVEDVELMVPDISEEGDYGLVNAIIDKRINDVFPLVEKFKGQSFEFSRFVSMLYNNYRRMFFASVSGKSVSELAEGLKVKEWAIVNAKSTASRYPRQKLKNALDYLSALERELKSGLFSSECPFEDVVLHLLNI